MKTNLGIAAAAVLAQARGIDADVKPARFGMPDVTYYTGAPLHCIDALDACGISSE